MTQNRIVLIVDDEENIRLTLLETLASMGVQAKAAENGREALSMLSRRRFDLVLLDLKLPGLGGMEVLHEVARRSPNIPVVLITAHGDIGTAVAAMQAGADAFIEKPFTPQEIRALVARTLDREARTHAFLARYHDHIRLAKTSVEERRLEAALEHARQALALMPAQPAPFNIMGVVMQLKMRISEAQKYYRSALALDDAFEPAWKNLENLSGFPRELSRFELDES